MKSLDTETTGLDLRHGARPFFVTMCDEDQNISCWGHDWRVDPYTRKVEVPRGDLLEIQEAIEAEDELILHNSKFDHLALSLLFRDNGLELKWEWDKVRDTLYAAHLLASNQPKDLTTATLIYLKENIQKYEVATEIACKEARNIARSKWFVEKHGEWRTAKDGLPEMPSAKETVWKFDLWLPRAIAIAEEYEESHPWWTVTEEYANVDSAVTLPLYLEMKRRMKERGLWRIYLERLDLLPVISAMTDRGTTVHRPTLVELRDNYTEVTDDAERKCCSLSGGKMESLPLGGRSKVLEDVLFNHFKLESNKKTKKGNVSMDKNVLEYWSTVLPPRSKPRRFIQLLRTFRQRRTAIGYMNSYERFGVPIEDAPDHFRIYPDLNAVGTDTLRFACRNPNDQNISKQGIDRICPKCEGEGCDYCKGEGTVADTLRAMFGPTSDREWYSMDARNIELRLAAYRSEERLLIELFERPDEPPYYGSTHLLNFHTVYPDIWNAAKAEVGEEKVGPYCKKKYASTWYQWVKNGGFAVQYGAVEKIGGTADRAFHKEGAHALLKARFSKLEKLNQSCIKQAERLGYVETIPDKTVDPSRGYPLLCTKTRWGGVLATVPLNYHIQGSAMWWMCKAMVRAHKLLQERNERRTSQAYLIMQIHDELVFDFPKAKHTPVEVKNEGAFKRMMSNLPLVEALRREMEKSGDDFGIPTPVSIEYHPKNWGEGITL